MKRTTVFWAINLALLQSLLIVILRFFPFTRRAPEIPSPKPRAKYDDIFFDPVTKLLTIKNMPSGYIAGIQDTNSMDGLLDIGLWPYMTKDFTIDDLTTGDVIIYTKGGNEQIMHQIVFIGEDKEGWFCICRGLNNFFPDAWAIRFPQIISRLAMIVYG